MNAPAAPAAPAAGDSIGATHRVERLGMTLSLEYSQFIMDFGESAVVGLSWEDPLVLAFQSDFGRVVWRRCASSVSLATATDPDFAFLREEAGASDRILDEYFA